MEKQYYCNSWSLPDASFWSPAVSIAHVTGDTPLPEPNQGEVVKINGTPYRVEKCEKTTKTRFQLFVRPLD